MRMTPNDAPLLDWPRAQLMRERTAGNITLNGVALRDYQIAAIESIRPTGHQLVVLPTGSGKSLVAAALAADTARSGRRVLVATHRKELLQQDSAALAAYAPDVEQGTYSAGLGSRETDAAVLFGGIQSIYQRLDELQQAGAFDDIIVDEAHLIPRETHTMYGRLIAELPHARRIGLTATPYRLDSGLLTDGEDALFDDIACQVTARQMVHDGWLAPLVGKGGDAEISVQGVRKRMGDFVPSDLAQAAEDEQLVTRACAEIIQRGRERRSWLLFGSSVAHAEMLQAELRRQGIDAGLVTGQTPSDERAELIDRFRATELRCLVNVNVLTTGFDAPGIDLLGLLRPTMSKSLHVQMLGRGMRLFEGKDDCRVLDFAGNCRRHGDIDLLQSFEESDATLDREAREREAADKWRQLVKHAGEAQDIDGHDTPVELRVTGMRYAAAESRTKPGFTNVIVTYLTDGPSIKIWLCPEYQGGARFFVRRWFERRGVHAPFTAGECISLARSLPQPEVIVAHREGKFWRVSLEQMPYDGTGGYDG